MKCRYSHCKHESREVDKSEAIRCGNFYYHPDCFKEKELLNKITETYISKVDSAPVMSQLRSIINTIVFKQGVSPEFLLFALQKANISHPPGLYYAVKNESIIQEWNAIQASNKTKDYSFSAEADYLPDDNFNYTPNKNRGFTKILR